MRIAPKKTLTLIIPIILIPDWSQTKSVSENYCQNICEKKNDLVLSRVKSSLKYLFDSCYSFGFGFLKQWHFFSYIPHAFLDMMELEIRGTEETVAVTSLIEYNTLSAGTIASVCPTIQQPTFCTISQIRFESIFTWNPRMDSSLSRVPPK